MEHVVFFTGQPGEPGFRRVGDLEEAVRLVESLRNEHGVVDATVHALTPVPVSFRTYYRVEIGSGAEQGPPVAAGPVAEPAVQEPAVPVDAIGTADVVVPVVVPLEPEPEPGYGLLTAELSAFEARAFEIPAPAESAFDEFGLDASPADEPAAPPLVLLPAPVEDWSGGSWDGEQWAELEAPAEAEVPVTDIDAPFPEAPVAALVEAPVEDEAEVPAVAGSDESVAVESLVPQVRPEPEAERSLGYFAN